MFKHNLTFSPFGKHLKFVCLAVETEVKQVLNDCFDWGNAVGDAVILSGITFFTTVGATAYVGVSGQNVLLAGLLAAGGQFFTILALKRGLIKNDKP